MTRDPQPPTVRPVSVALALALGGVYLLTGALVVIVAAVVLALSDGPGGLLFWLVAALLVGLAGLALALRLRPLLRLDEGGYRVRWLRGAGLRDARWDDVAEATAEHVRGRACLVLRTHDQRTTTIPVQALAGDREALAIDVRTRLRRAAARRR